MPRIARIAPNDYVYHVLCRGNDKKTVFKDDNDYEKYLEILQRYKERYKFSLYHYVLMGTHIHLVVEPIEGGGRLSDIMKGTNLSYVLYYKNRYSHIGHFWQDRFKSIVISKDDYLLACGSYVELNPVRARMVKDPGDYRWSSYKAYAYGKKDNLVDEHLIYTQLSENKVERRRKYREFVRGMIRDRGSMKGEMDRKTIYGSDDFVTSLKEQFKIEATIRPRGRPRQHNKHNK